jgi:hypothetical protein
MFRPSAASEKIRNGMRMPEASTRWPDERHADEEADQQRCDADAILADREDLLVGA